MAPKKNTAATTATTTEKRRITRKKHRKSRVGCPECRKRKVKCDETLPACAKCMVRGVRCGYLDYSERELDIVRLAHWEADGADPSKMPVQPQQFNPEMELDVLQYHKVGSSSVQNSDPGQDQDSHSSESEDSLVGLSPPPTLRYPLQGSSISQYSVEEEEADGYIGTEDPLSLLDLNKFEIPLINHLIIRPRLDIEAKYPSYFNETVSSFTARHIIRRSIHEHLLLSSFEDPRSFYASLLLSYGSALAEDPDLLPNFLEIRGICMNFVLKELLTVDDSNVLQILTASTALDLSSVFVMDKAGYKQRFKFSTGPSSILRKVYEDPSLFPKSFPTLKIYGDAMLYSTKYVWVPQYDFKVLFEFLDVLKEFGQKFIIKTHDHELVEQYDSMVEFIGFCLELFENNESSESVLRYPIEKLYDLIQRWFSIIPSECFTIGSKTPQIRKVFFVFWFALLKILESLIVSCRYIFSFFLDGFFLINVFQRDLIEKNINSHELRWHFNYCCRIISFLDRRMCYVMRNTTLSEPIPSFLDLKDRLKVRPLNIHECCITSFKTTVIKRCHYPTEVDRFTQALNSSSPLYGDSPNPNEDLDVFDTTLIDNFKVLEANDANENVDLLNNINPESSLLYNDYDPRFVDPIFEGDVAVHDANLEFFDRYIEDRKLILQMINES